MEIVDNLVETVDNSTEGSQSDQEINYETLYRQSADALSELTAERDSLLSENAELRAARDAAIADGQKTKELNYTLARQLNIAQDSKKSPEEIMASMFLKKGDKTNGN